MVSLRCKIVVKQEFANLGLSPASIDLGVVEVGDAIPDEVLENLRKNLERCGLELLDDRNSVLIEKIKAVIIEMIHYSDENPKLNYSDYISEKLKYDYTYLSNIFSKMKGMTIQQFIIMNKVERIKDLLKNEELSLTEISYKLNYSSVAHLSNQFKKVTGISPSEYRQLKTENKKLEAAEVS